MVDCLVEKGCNGFKIGCGVYNYEFGSWVFVLDLEVLEIVK